MGPLLQGWALCCAAIVFIFTPAKATWAVPGGTAHSRVQTYLEGRAVIPPAATGGIIAKQQSNTARVGPPHLVRIREVEGRGLLLSAWINGQGPFTFAVDTGAGATLLSRSVAAQARVAIRRKQAVTIGGLSGSGVQRSDEGSISSIAVGDRWNILPSSSLVIVAERLAPGIDGVLDPITAYGSFGFEIDMSRGEITAFDPRLNPLRSEPGHPNDETIVRWMTDAQSSRPFVMLGGGRRALLDTGSGFGLAVAQEAARSLGIRPSGGRESGDTRDLSGGRIAAHRISPTTISIGSLVLRGIPTDLLSSVRAGAPIVLGRDALRPFRLTFDPISRLIKIVPSRQRTAF